MASRVYPATAVLDPGVKHQDDDMGPVRFPFIVDPGSKKLPSRFFHEIINMINI
jgi:hypothetical protein